MFPNGQHRSVSLKSSQTNLLGLVDTNERKGGARRLSAIYAPVSFPIPNDAPPLRQQATVTWFQLLNRCQKAEAELRTAFTHSLTSPRSRLRGQRQPRRARREALLLVRAKKQPQERASSERTAEPAQGLLIRSRLPANSSRSTKIWNWRYQV